MQPCKTGDQPYSDASPNGECSLAMYYKYQDLQNDPYNEWLQA